MSLMDMLATAPSAVERLQQYSPILSANADMGSMPGNVDISGQGGGSVEAQARRFFLENGYSKPDWRKVDSIIEQESGWDPNAMNDSSGAAGLAQKISGYSGNYSQNDPLEQIRWLFNYLDSHVYPQGTGIDAAYQHKQQTGWY